MIKHNDRYIVEKVLKMVQQTHDTGFDEEEIMSQSVDPVHPDPQQLDREVRYVANVWERQHVSRP